MRHIELSLCRGAKNGGCPYALPLDPTLIAGIEALVVARGDALISPEAKFPKNHERFRVRLAACANGCSSPHTGDVGLIVAVHPEFLPDRCTGCGACVQACPDGAISLHHSAVLIDRTRCLDCGRCVRACPSHALVPDGSGLRVLIAGRLGRRPQLAAKLPGLLDPLSFPALLTRMLDLLDETPGAKRLADCGNQTEMLDRLA